MNTYFNQKIERIICPFDFSATGNTGLDYAGMLAAALGANLTIFYVQPSIWPEELQLYEDRNDDAKAIKRQLQLEVKRIEDSLGIKCNYAVEPTTDFNIPIGAVSADYDLIVMGTNGADDLFQHVFGKNSHHVLGLARCPVLMVPEGYATRVPKLIVYAFDPETKPVFLESHVENLTVPLGAEVRTFDVAPQAITSESERKMALLGEMLGVEKDPAFDWDFEPVYPDEAVSAVDAYMKGSGADMLALSYNYRTLFEKLFQANVIRGINRIADYPVLVFWH